MGDLKREHKGVAPLGERVGIAGRLVSQVSKTVKAHSETKRSTPARTASTTSPAEAKWAGEETGGYALAEKAAGTTRSCDAGNARYAV